MNLEKSFTKFDIVFIFKITAIKISKLFLTLIGVAGFLLQKRLIDKVLVCKAGVSIR
ncbi:MAG: hypothetical protein GDA42_00135 [Ekhidna sp.]|nr:hypothetical protein [Ekhidna sp.]